MGTRHEVLSLYRQIFRIARKWQAASGLKEETIKEKKYIVDEARKLFYKNKKITDLQMIKMCIEECKARVEIGLHYRNPYPRPIHLPPLGLAVPHSKVLRTQEKLRKQAKPVYLKSYDEIS
ncbi:hypothetical protein XENTR_v10024004 [Xenopus tropicalis]|uniref:LYR motif containing 1 n=1 Tax=Xenopus tropicalis TaxID=8364 RepID=A0A6I8SS75_XENTR|nr:LYR motif-containing protein 1 [Xenopus tropicalis]XP_031748626.1 LYR motif-containing protein 1 [Xenopus tropicalis]KAE8579343.1 hypothetical protein XENTR_v10024004 [Xenopus tropicalis]KAE8579344.1 hypothetical protein XENTR_v10024004 [Xenopus tropicalis]|eukprot:XP_002932006.1 PREDICTED: LYR motif-containing protein 1 [Xenopus tropicalis]